MATSTDYAIREGTMKMGDIAWDFVDGLVFEVAASVAATLIAGADFTVETTATLDVTGDDAWPAAGHFCINGRVYSYDSISGTSFIDCNGPLGDQEAVAISDGETGAQAVPATVVNGLIQACLPGMVYQDKDQTGLDVTIAPFTMFDGTTTDDYAGGTETLTDDATCYIYAYNSGGTCTIAENNTSWAAAETAAGSRIIPLAKLTTASGAITAYVDCRAKASGLRIPGDAALWQRTGTVLSPATAGDTVELAQTSTTGSALEVTRDLAAASTDSPVVNIVQDNAGDDRNALYVVNDGTASAIYAQNTGAGSYAVVGENNGTTNGDAGVRGVASGATGEVHGVRGDTDSTDNAAYGGSFGRTNVGTWADFDERSSAASPPVVVPPADVGRLYCVDDDTFTFVNSAGMAYGYSDQDHDTVIWVEESDDEDKVRIDTGGTERLAMDATSARFSTPVGATTKYIIDGNDGIDAASIAIITDVDFNTMQIKYRTATWEGGILTAMSAESDWTAAPLNP